MSAPASSDQTPSASHASFDDSPRSTSSIVSARPTHGLESDTSSRTPDRSLPVAVEKRFGPYDIVAELGRGGMGVVYHVRDTRLGRDVALKKIRNGLLASPEEIERFAREARAIAQLKHPHVIQLYDVGDVGGQHYYTMELAPGGSLASERVRFQNDLPKLLALLAKVARAAAYVHANGLYHRDLKPGNVLLTAEDEPLISDFGLVKEADSAQDLTQTGAQPGTLAYMAPEQLADHQAEVGCPADVWAIGVIAYEVICGQRPFAGADRRSTSGKVLREPPTPPRRLRPNLDADLETILLKCLEKEPQLRYSAAALADDIEALLADRQIKARPISQAQRLARWGRRHPWTVAGAAVLCLLAIVLPMALRRTPDPNSYAEVQAMQTELLQRHQVTMIAATGPPSWSQWVGKGTVVAAGDEVFQISAERQAMLLLLPDPKLDGKVGSYTFEAMVRIDSYPRGAAGLFVGQTAHNTDDGRMYGQAIAHVSFFPPDPDHEMQPHFVLSHFFPSGEPGDTRQIGLSDRREKSPTGWYHLRIDVGPREAMQVAVDGKDIGVLTSDGRLQTAGGMVRDRLRQDKLSLAVPVFPPRGGMGLYINGGTASFRNVIITPAPLAAGDG